MIPIPLKVPDPDIAVDLQALLHEMYEAASYGRDSLLYAQPPEPPLSDEDRAWAEGVLEKARA
jgi:hypothetical protein